MRRVMVVQLALVLACLIVSFLSVSCTGDLALRKEQAEASRRLAEGYLAEGNATAALAELLKAEKSYDQDPYLQYDLGLAYFAKEEFELAIEHFNRALELRPDYSEAFNAKGTIYLRLQQWDKAISCLNKARANLLYATPHMALNNLGEAYRGKGHYGRAIQFYEKAIQAMPRFPQAHRGLGLAYMDIGDYESAVMSLQKALEYAPNFAAAQYDLGRAYAWQHDTKRAISSFKKVMELAPDSQLADRALTEIMRLQE
jgi:tetratricopeptide (TPR) repeat protein